MDDNARFSSLRLKHPKLEEAAACAELLKSDCFSLNKLLARLVDLTKIQQGGVYSVVDLSRELAASGLLHRPNLPKLLSGSVVTTTRKFLQCVHNMCRSVARDGSRSAKVARHEMHEFNLIRGLGATVGDLCGKAALEPSEAQRAKILVKILQELDTTWEQMCIPLIEAEKLANSGEIACLLKLIAVLQSVAVMRTKKRDAAVCHSFASPVLLQNAHVLVRMATDEWAATRRVPVQELLSFSVDIEAAEKMDGWLESWQEILIASLQKDTERLQALAEADAAHDCWHGLKLVEQLVQSHGEPTAPFGSIRLLAPAHAGRFLTEDGGVSVVNINPSHANRNIDLVRTMQAIKTLFKNGWFPTGLFVIEFAVSVVEAELRNVLASLSLTMQHLVALCEMHAFRTSIKGLDIVLDLTMRQTTRPTAAICVEEVPTRRRMSDGQLLNDYYLVRPSVRQSKASTVFRPGYVERTSLLEYIVVFELANMVNTVLEAPHEPYERGVVAWSNSDIVDAVKRRLLALERQSLTLTGPQRVFFNGTTSKNNIVIQLVAATVRKLMAVGKTGCAAAIRAQVPSAVTWTASYAANRKNGENILHVADSSLDNSCYLFVELCLRIVFFLDEGWPLPEGVDWSAAPKARRNARKHARGVCHLGPSKNDVTCQSEC